MKGMINCHTHLFNEYHVPEDLLKLYVKWIPNFLLPSVGSILDHPLGNRALNLFSYFGTDSIKRYINFIKFGYGMTVRQQFEILRSAYPPKTRFVVLMQDFKFVSNAKAKVSYDDFVKEILELKHQFPTEILPFYFMEPRNYDFLTDPNEIYQLLQEKFASGCFLGLKMYPAEGYFPWDFRLRPFYQFAIDNKLPIMTHCSIGGSRYVKQTTEIDRNPLDLNGQHRKINLPSLAWLNVRKDYTGRARCFSDPDNYIEVLKEFKDLKICLAHSGSNEEINLEIDRRNGKNKDKRNWYQKCLELVDNNSNVYMDVSYSLYDEHFIKELIKSDFDSNIHSHRSNRLLFGTDFYMTYTEVGAGEKDLPKVERSLREKMSQHLSPNLFDKMAYQNAETWMKSSIYK
ncbi:MAG: amidohydrolase family protein [Saprospiraceae bacterium]|nr:amidohydrolase family protein [Saprospiraceae bacterium]